MRPFLKAQASSLAASAADFTATIILKEVFHIWYLAASVLGTITGGVINFFINRIWVFEARDSKTEMSLTGGDMSVMYNDEEDENKPMGIQAFRYMLVWTGSLLLNAAGVFLLTHYGDVSYLVSKIFVSLVVGFSYNYLLQKRFVFSRA